MKIYLILKLTSFWIGIHHSKYYKRICINILPCCTICIVWKYGKKPDKFNYRLI